MAKVLVIDDEIGVRESLSLILRMEGYDVVCGESASSGIRLIDDGGNYDFIICDIRMPGMDGIQFLREIQNRDLSSIVIMISAYGTVETSIEAIKSGADDYINKPINSEELVLRMRMAEERKRLRKENLYLHKELGKQKGFEAIVFVSEKVKEVVNFAKKISEYKTTVLITGESGTGKELIARAIHTSSPRKNKPYVAVNCAAIPESLLESELFGYVKGAFSGASNTKRGLFEEAHGGTLFLDEIGEFPNHLQSKLLRVLQEAEIRRLGDTKTIKVDVRIIAATSRDLAQDVIQGTFREDLFYRLNILPVHIPPLRERKEDILVLVEHFIEKYNEKLGCYIKGVSPGVMSELHEYPWRGNVRELENVIERAMILTDSDLIHRIDLGLRGNDQESASDSLSLNEAWQRLEKAYIEKALSQTGGNRTQAAKLLGLSRRALLYKLKQYGYSEEED
ncbi:MAG: sigma-54-dependent Fis family transcriptional regulator [Deltaproteobacteria bacterium]|nr:sigma-54-dependent Fis family transcriptional regulator [Deltaproteobacteria bacterium]